MVATVYSGMGYTLADDTASGGKRREADLLGCNHCQRLMRKHWWQQDGGMCLQCSRPVCPGCRDRIPTHGCENFMRRLEGALNDRYRRDQNARVLGT